MNFKKIILFIVFALVFAKYVPVKAQDENQPKNGFKQILQASGIDSNDVLLGELSKAFSTILNENESINTALKMLVKSDSFLRFFKDVDLKIKSFYVDKSKSSSLGLNYSYAKNIKSGFFKEDNTNQAGLTFSLNMNGNIAFDKSVNLSDFIDTELSLHFFQSIGGAIEVSDEIADLLDDLTFQLADINDQELLDNSPLWKNFLNIVSNNMGLQFYYDFSFHGGLESDQSFINKQYYYGTQVGIDFKAWNSKSFWAEWNVFDWPFAAIRWLSGSDMIFTPQGSNYPTVLFGVDYVDPKKDTLRSIEEKIEPYSRLRGEVSFKSLLLNSSVNRIFFEANYRYYREIGASSFIRKAGLDEYSYFAGSITSSNGVFMTYTNGKLPFDATNDKIYELGFKMSF